MSTTKTRELLKHALRALNETRCTRLHNDEYKDTYALAPAIDTHFAENGAAPGVHARLLWRSR